MPNEDKSDEIKYTPEQIAEHERREKKAAKANKGLPREEALEPEPAGPESMPPAPKAAQKKKNGRK